jgi:hypothetical protein
MTPEVTEGNRERESWGTVTAGRAAEELAYSGMAACRALRTQARRGGAAAGRLPSTRARRAFDKTLVGCS